MFPRSFSLFFALSFGAPLPPFVKGIPVAVPRWGYRPAVLSCFPEEEAMSEPGTNVAAEEPVPDIPTRIRTGLSAGFGTSIKIIKVSVPLYVAVTLLKGTPFLDLLGKVFAPVMGIFGLPGEAAFAFVAAFLLNLYAAIAVIAPLHLTPFQVTQCGLMMGIAHNRVVEGGVLSTTGARGGVLTLCRLVIACVAGLLLRGLWSLCETAASWAMALPGFS